MDYKINNTNLLIDSKLLSKAQELANNNERTATGKNITPSEVKQLITEAKSNDNFVSEEEIRFIAGLLTEENIKSLNTSNFNPVNDSIKFKNVQPSYLNMVRNLAESVNKSSTQSSVDKNVKTIEALKPLFNALNDDALNIDNRRKIIQDYLGQTGSSTQHLKTIYREDFFQAISASSEPGLSPYLYQESKNKPNKDILLSLSQYLEDYRNKSPQEIYDFTINTAKNLGSLAPERDTLKALATIVNGVHKLYPEQEPFRESLRRAYIHLNESENSIVMGKGVQATPGENKDYTWDNNMHFWSHAFISYELMSRDYSADSAKQFSAYVGTIKEIGLPGSPFSGRDMRENEGNAAIKDIIINAYGSEFGVQLFQNRNIKLPQKHEGPMIQDRSVSRTSESIPRYTESY